MKEIIIGRLQEKNENLTEKCCRLKSAVDTFEQCGRRNKIVLTGISDNVSDRDLEDPKNDIEVGMILKLTIGLVSQIRN